MYDFIHTKRRNRLSTDKVDKLYANAAIEALLQKEADFARMSLCLTVVTSLKMNVIVIMM